jgi:hypothetical protein
MSNNPEWMKSNNHKVFRRNLGLTSLMPENINPSTWSKQI